MSYKKKKDYYLKQTKKYALENKDHLRKKQKEYNEKNIDKVRQYKRDYYNRNRKKVNDACLKWARENKERRKEITSRSSKKRSYIGNHHTAKRRATKKNATPSWAELDKIKLVYKKAKEFSKILGINLHVDHIVPLQSKNVCGLHVWANLQLLEAGENIKKGNRYW